MARQPKPLPQSVVDEMRDRHLPAGGVCPFVPKVGQSKSGEPTIRRGRVAHGPKRGQAGFLDTTGRIRIRDPAHAGLPEHWDVQTDGGRGYDRVDDGKYVV